MSPIYGNFTLKNLKCFITCNIFINPYFSYDILFTDLGTDPFYIDYILKSSQIFLVITLTLLICIIIALSSEYNTYFINLPFYDIITYTHTQYEKSNGSLYLMKTNNKLSPVPSLITPKNNLSSFREMFPCIYILKSIQNYHTIIC